MAGFDERKYNENEKSGFVPPPPNDITIRTMESDIKSMMLSGGSFVQADSVQAGEKREMPASKEIREDIEIPRPETGQAKRSGVFVWIYLLLGLLLLGAIAYFVYPLVSGLSDDDSNPPTNSEMPVLPGVPDDVLATTFTHQSFFRKSGDVVLDMNLKFSGSKTLETIVFKDKIRELLGPVKTDSFIEINVRKIGGQHLSLAEFSGYVGLDFMASGFAENNFDQDFTFFVLKNKDGYWPGAVLKLAPERSWVALKPELAKKIEEGGAVDAFFVTTGGAVTTEFADVFVSGRSARMRDYSASSAAFIYGWFLEKVVLSTSEAGLKEAVGRL